MHSSTKNNLSDSIILDSQKSQFENIYTISEFWNGLPYFA